MSLDTERLIEASAADFVGVDIGCGSGKRKGFLGIDVRRSSEADIVSDARHLPFKSEALSMVYSSHTIEHFSFNQSKDLITEWLRILKKGGTIEIRCPDLRARALIFAIKPNWTGVRNIYGEQDHEFNFHRSGFSFGLLKSLLESQGVDHVQRIIKGYKGIPFLPDSLHLRGLKK